MPILRHDTYKNISFNFFKKNRVIKKIIDYCCSEKTVNRGSFILQVARKHRQNEAPLNLGTHWVFKWLLQVVF